MKLKKILIIIGVLIIFSTATVLANDTFEMYKGKDVTVIVNDKKVPSNGLLIEGTTYLPLRDIADTLQAIVHWDGKTETVSIHKPNVHISLVQMVRGGSFTTFGQVYHKSKYGFNIFTQVDNITTHVHSFEIAIVDPKGDKVYSYEDELKEQKENVWIGTERIDLEFKELGNYKVQVFMKVSKDAPYSLVSEKSFPSIARP